MNSVAVKIWLLLLLVVGASYAAYTIRKKNVAREETAQSEAASAKVGARPADGLFLVEGSVPAVQGTRGAVQGSGAAAAAASEIPPVVVDLETFKMTERSGQDMSLGELRGQVWIGSMFYASCPYSCRALNQRIAALHREPRFKDVKFVSISVDPATDTPEKLRETANILGADPKRWLFLNGKLDDVARLGKQAKVTAGYQEHQDRLILFDRQGHVRGWFLFKDDGQIDKLREAVPKLLAENPTKME